MGESSFWYRPTRVVPDQRPLNGRFVVFPVSVTLIADSHEVYQEIIHHGEEYEMLLLGPNRVKLVKVKAE